MKTIKIALLGIVAIFITIILWMNVTQGYFQINKHTCEYEVIYVQDKNNIPHISDIARLCSSIPFSLKVVTNDTKLLLANFDFNR